MIRSCERITCHCFYFNGKTIDHGRLDVAGLHRVYADVLLRIIKRCRAGQADDRASSCVIVKTCAAFASASLTKIKGAEGSPKSEPTELGDIQRSVSVVPDKCAPHDQDTCFLSSLHQVLDEVPEVRTSKPVLACQRRTARIRRGQLTAHD